MRFQARVGCTAGASTSSRRLLCPITLGTFVAVQHICACKPALSADLNIMTVCLKCFVVKITMVVAYARQPIHERAHMHVPMLVHNMA